MQQFINHNGKIVAADKPSVGHENRAFRYGDALFETIRIVKGVPLFLDDHVTRLMHGLTLMKMNIPANLNSAILEHLITDLCKRNGITSDGRARFIVYRNNGGFYVPTDNRVSFLLEVEVLEGQGYRLNEEGLSVDIFQELKKVPNKLAAIKSANSALYVIAGVYKTQKGLDECVLINDKMNAIEAISSNLFAVKNEVLYTAPLIEGCINGVMRKQIMELAASNRIAVHEVPFPLSILLNSDEIFLTNAIQGIQWVATYKNKNYSNKISKRLLEMLNEMVLQDK